MKKIAFIFGALCLIAFSTFGQIGEQISPILVNPVVHQEAKKLGAIRNRTVVDTLTLPFIEDFSTSSVFPSSQKWLDQRVFINNTFSNNPPTFNFATFDGLDSIGHAYDYSTTTTRGAADYLTSKPLNLAGFSVSDSLYLSFWYEPKGLGEQPDPNDSLVLLARKSDGTWQQLWGKKGYVDSVFRLAMIPIKNLDYLYKGFQFRFQAYGSLAGNFDHWHVDYVVLNSGRSYKDTLARDVAWMSTPSDLLKKYTIMPWSHFIVNPSSQLDSPYWVSSRNLGIPINTTFGYSFLAEKPALGVLFTQPNAALNYPRDTIFQHRFRSFNPSNISGAGDTVILSQRYYITASPDNIRSNDTIVKKQIFTNRFAYDDGTPEYCYGLNFIGGQIAYKFVLPKSDSLRAIDMLWVQNSIPVNTELFTLKIWSSLPEPGTANPEVIIYSKTFQKPRYLDSLNQFVTYALDSAIPVKDSIYVGWQQGTNKLLNIGIDYNHNANANMFVNIGSGWARSVIQSAWCIRPVIGNADLFFVGVKESTQRKLAIYPNPSSGLMKIEGISPGTALQLFSSSGQKVKDFRLEENLQIDIQELPAGVYFLHWVDNHQSGVEKVVKW